MTGGGPPKRIEPEEPSPPPTPILGEETDSAKKKVRRKGRSANILAGRMMGERKQILKTHVGE